jgi:hypothetical protein
MPVTQEANLNKSCKQLDFNTISNPTISRFKEIDKMKKIVQTISKKTAGAVVRKIMALSLTMMALLMTNVTITLAQNRYAAQHPYTKQNHYMVPVSSKVGGFYALMPGEAKYTTQPITIKDGSTITMHSFIHETPDSKFAYGVTYADYHSSIAGDNLDRLYNEMAQDCAQSINGRVVLTTATIQNDYQALFVKIETATMLYYNKVILAGTKLYQVIFVMPKSATLPDTFVEFYESFRIE